MSAEAAPGRSLAPIAPLVDLYRVRESAEDEARFVKLHRNERLGALPEWFVQRIRAAVTSDLFTSYPVTEPLYRKLAAALDLPDDHLLLTPGSDAAIKAIVHAYAGPDDVAVMLDPSYAMYPVYAQMFGAQARRIAYGPGATIELDAVRDAIRPDVSLVLIANPDQPTGTVIDDDAIAGLAEHAAANGALFAIDEAYHQFAGVDLLRLARELDNVVVVRTLSKAAGLAGLRVGYVAGPPEIVGTISKVRTVHDVNSVAALCADLVLDHPEIMRDYVSEVEQGARVLGDRARAAGLAPRPVHTNFMVIDLSDVAAPADVVAGMQARGYMIKGPFAPQCLEGCIRITLGPPELMEEAASALQSTLDELGSTATADR